MSAIVSKRFLGLFTIAFLVMVPYAAWATGWDFTEMPADWTMYGNALHDSGNGWIQLTSDAAAGYEAGAVFYNVPMNTATWKAEFDIYCGANDGGADGATFAWVTSPGVGTNGGQMGFLAGLDGYCIEFDNYAGNDSLPGPADTENHVGVSRTGETFALWDLPYDLENNTWFHARVAFESGHVQMWMSNDSVGWAEELVIDYTIPDWADYDAYFGFTAATGGAVNVHAVDNVIFGVPTDAGPDQWVQGGTEVTLTGTGPEDATSFSWQQIILSDEPMVTLSDPNSAVTTFTPPVREIGYMLTFRLTVGSPSEGPTTDETHVYVTALNEPKLVPQNFRIYPSHLGFRLEWDMMIDATEYGVGFKLGEDLYFWFWTSNTYYDL
jgi:hypothetical protein